MYDVTNPVADAVSFVEPAPAGLKANGVFDEFDPPGTANEIDCAAALLPSTSPPVAAFEFVTATVTPGPPARGSWC